jgi:hypothetical protein
MDNARENWGVHIFWDPVAVNLQSSYVDER